MEEITEITEAHKMATTIDKLRTKVTFDEESTSPQWVTTIHPITGKPGVADLIGIQTEKTDSSTIPEAPTTMLETTTQTAKEVDVSTSTSIADKLAIARETTARTAASSKVQVSSLSIEDVHKQTTSEIQSDDASTSFISFTQTTQKETTRTPSKTAEQTDAFAQTTKIDAKEESVMTSISSTDRHVGETESSTSFTGTVSSTESKSIDMLSTVTLRRSDDNILTTESLAEENTAPSSFITTDSSLIKADTSAYEASTSTDVSTEKTVAKTESAIVTLKQEETIAPRKIFNTTDEVSTMYTETSSTERQEDETTAEPTTASTSEIPFSISTSKEEQITDESIISTPFKSAMDKEGSKTSSTTSSLLSSTKDLDTTDKKTDLSDEIIKGEIQNVTNVTTFSVSEVTAAETLIPKTLSTFAPEDKITVHASRLNESETADHWTSSDMTKGVVSTLSTFTSIKDFQTVADENKTSSEEAGIDSIMRSTEQVSLKMSTHADEIQPEITTKTQAPQTDTTSRSEMTASDTNATADESMQSDADDLFVTRTTEEPSSDGAERKMDIPKTTPAKALRAETIVETSFDLDTRPEPTSIPIVEPVKNETVTMSTRTSLPMNITLPIGSMFPKFTSVSLHTGTSERLPTLLDVAVTKTTTKKEEATTEPDVSSTSTRSSTLAEEIPTTRATNATTLQDSVTTQDTANHTLPEYTDYLDDGVCILDGRLYHSAQQIDRPDPCQFCFCFRSEIICLEQSCPPPLFGCHEKPVPGYCCPRFECPILVTSRNITKISRIGSRGQQPIYIQQKHMTKRHIRSTVEVEVKGCSVNGTFYEIGQTVSSVSGPCLHCQCHVDGIMRCDPKKCKPEAPLLLKMNRNMTRRKR